MAIRLALAICMVVLALRAQTAGGSTGVDGALVLTTPGVVVFDPSAFDPPLNAAGDNVFHFTTIHIASGVTLRLSAKVLHGPVYWLAQGPVQIDGIIDLDGGDGAASARVPSDAGAGGYPGGGVGRAGYSPGPEVKRNAFLVPLFGGSGGAGGKNCVGGAGGGALLISSAISIGVDGYILANGGNAAEACGGAGSGGAIRLVAPTITGTGTVSAKGGPPDGVDGLVRFESADNHFAGSLNNTPAAYGKPLGLFLPPDPPPSARIVSIGGTAVTGREFTINQPSPVAVVVEARFIPAGTVIQLEFFPENGPPVSVSTTPLEGSFKLSWATASVTFPVGSSHAYVKASWNLPARDQPPR